MSRTARILAGLLIGGIVASLCGCPRKSAPEPVAPPPEAERAAERAAREAEAFITPSAEETANEETLNLPEDEEPAGVTPVPAIRWVTGYEETMKKAADSGKPALVFFWGEKYPPAKMFDDQNWSDLKVRAEADNFVCGRVDVGQDKATPEKLDVKLIPTVLFLTPQGKEISRIQHLVTPKTLLHEMRKALGN